MIRIGKCNSVAIGFALILVLSALSISMRMGAPYVYGSAVIWTDKPDYAPLETVTIFGSSFKPNTNIILTITRPNLVVDTLSAMSDDSGNFVCCYALDGIFGTYMVNATDGTNSATTTFTDTGVDFRQYANDLDQWINSILQSGKSTYYEGMSVPQRVIFVDVASTSGNVHTLTLSHEATKGGIHAYDWLTGWNQGNVPPLSYTPCGDNIGPQATTAICQALHAKTSPYEIYVDVPDDPFISKDGSTQARIDACEAAWGNRQIRICGNQPITSAGFSAMSHDVADGGDTGDSFILYTLTWTSTSGQILIELAGHLAMSGNPIVNPIAWGVGLGSSCVGGGPYHFKLDELDGDSLGSQDNQIMGANIIIPAGHIIVHETTVPAGDPADFTFDPDYQLSNFVLSDGEQYDSGALVPGTYHVQELALVGWDLIGLTVTDPSSGSSTNLGSGVATIGLAAGETVHVYYINAVKPPTGTGTIVVEKITLGGVDTFDFVGTGTMLPAGFSSFSITTVTPGVAAITGFTNVSPGQYEVIEGPEAPWQLTSITITGDDDYSNGNLGTRTATVMVDPNEQIIITFTSVKPGPVGGEWVPMSISSLLAPLWSFGFVTALMTVSFVYVKRKKKQIG